jgi:hypothetical protein
LELIPELLKSLKFGLCNNSIRDDLWTNVSRFLGHCPCKFCVAYQRAVLQAEETEDCDGCVVDHWHYLVDDTPECLSELQARIGDQPAALVGRPESDQAKYGFCLFCICSQ